MLPNFKDHENCNAMSSITVVRHVPRNTYLQGSVMFSLVYVFFSDVGGKELSLFVEIQYIDQLLSVMFKKTFQDHYNLKILPSRMEMFSLDLKFQRQILQEIS